jgi:hypothetical protein
MGIFWFESPESPGEDYDFNVLDLPTRNFLVESRLILVTTLGVYPGGVA